METNSKSALTIGLYGSILTVVLTIPTFIVSYLTPPLSGPLCRALNCFAYPFTNIASRFPRDYYWMYLAILLTLVYLVWITSIHFYANAEKKVYSQIGLLFAWAAGIILIADYFVQLSIVQPSLMNGETDGISLFTQFNPHGIFIALEDLGYLLMSFAFLFLAPIFSGGKLAKSVRWTFVANFFLTILAFVWFSIQYGVLREYRFELAVISINWLTFIVAGVLLSIMLKRTVQNLPPEQS